MCPLVVVGAAIVEGNRLLAARRSRPPALAGWWELPGGKVDPGETDRAALVRECREELGVDVRLGTRVGGGWPISDGAVLRVWTATLAWGRPRPLEHTALRWLTAGELEDVAWLPADLPLVRQLRTVLGDPPRTAGEGPAPSRGTC